MRAMSTSKAAPPHLSKRVHWLPAAEMIIPDKHLVVANISMGIAAAKGDDRQFLSMIINDEYALCLGNDKKTLLGIAKMFEHYARRLKELER